MNVKILFLLMCFLTVPTAFAQEALPEESTLAPSAEPAAPRKRVAPKRQVEASTFDEADYKWIPMVMLGFTFGSSSSVSTEATSASASGASAFGFGAELGYRFGDYFQLGGLLEFTPYKYSSSAAGVAAAPSDSELGFMVLPRAQYETFRAVFWAGLGLGLIRTSFGTAIGDASSTVGFGISPRIGADFETGTNIVPGVQLAYTSTSSSLTSAAAEGVAATSVSISRRWMSISGRIGYRF